MNAAVPVSVLVYSTSLLGCTNFLWLSKPLSDRWWRVQLSVRLRSSHNKQYVNEGVFLTSKTSDRSCPDS
jgi:hypothetical protein